MKQSPSWVFKRSETDCVAHPPFSNVSILQWVRQTAWPTVTPLQTNQRQNLQQCLHFSRCETEYAAHRESTSDVIAEHILQQCFPPFRWETECVAHCDSTTDQPVELPTLQQHLPGVRQTGVWPTVIPQQTKQRNGTPYSNICHLSRSKTDWGVAQRDSTPDQPVEMPTLQQQGCGRRDSTTDQTVRRQTIEKKKWGWGSGGGEPERTPPFISPSRPLCSVWTTRRTLRCLTRNLSQNSDFSETVDRRGPLETGDTRSKRHSDLGWSLAKHRPLFSQLRFRGSLTSGFVSGCLQMAQSSNLVYLVYRSNPHNPLLLLEDSFSPPTDIGIVVHCTHWKAQSDTL